MTLLDMEGFDDQTATLDWTFSTTGATFQTGRVNGFCLRENQITAKKAVTASATIIVGMAVRVSNVTVVGVARMPGLFGDSGTTAHIYVSINGSGFAELRNGAGTVLATATAGAFNVNVWQYVELKATIADSGGRATVKINGVIVIDFTGDTRNGGTSTNVDMIQIGTTGNNYNLDIDDLYVCDGLGSTSNDFLGDVRVETLYPNGNGNSSQWVGSDADSVNNYLLVNEAGAASTANYVGSPTVGNKDTYAFGDLSTSPTVYGVKITAHANNSDAGAGSIKLVTRRSATDYSSAAIALASASAAASQLQVTDPSTSAAWTVAGVNAAEFGVEVA